MQTTIPAVCRHCQRAKVTRSRGLCWVCYYTPEVSALYPSTHPKGRRGVGQRGERLPAEATDAAPGTVAKLAALMARAESGCSLWHPDDNRHGVALTPREANRDATRHRVRVRHERGIVYVRREVENGLVRLAREPVAGVAG